MMKRFLDIAGALIGLVIFVLPLGLVALAIKLTSKGPILHWSERIGQYGIAFYMPKFRSMCVDTPHVATNLLENPQQFLTPIGSFIRKTSLDELPQLWSILKGDLSFVGPRPVLYNEQTLIELRRLKGIDRIRPGLTGWAQVNGRDTLSIEEKIAFEEDYLHRQSLSFDFYILWLTVLKVLRRENISY
jgi:O-antigen biosynthesis protein WbqP